MNPSSSIWNLEDDTRPEALMITLGTSGVPPTFNAWSANTNVEVKPPLKSMFDAVIVPSAVTLKKEDDIIILLLSPLLNEVDAEPLKKKSTLSCAVEPFSVFKEDSPSSFINHLPRKPPLAVINPTSSILNFGASIRPDALIITFGSAGVPPTFNFCSAKTKVEDKPPLKSMLEAVTLPSAVTTNPLADINILFRVAFDAVTGEPLIKNAIFAGSTCEPASFLRLCNTSTVIVFALHPPNSWLSDKPTTFVGAAEPEETSNGPSTNTACPPDIATSGTFPASAPAPMFIPEIPLTPSEPLVPLSPLTPLSPEFPLSPLFPLSPVFPL